MEQKQAHDAIHRAVIERFPLYREDPAFEAWVVERTAGDPERIDALLRQLREHGFISSEGVVSPEYSTISATAGLDERLADAIQAFEEPTLAVLRAASVQGGTFLSTLTVHAAGLAGEGELERALRPALDSGIIIEDGTDTTLGSPARRYRFEPVSASGVLYQSMAGDERALLHASIVQYLTERRANAGDPGMVEMVARLIDEHNRRASGPGGNG